MLLDGYSAAFLKAAVAAVSIWAILFLLRVSIEATRGNFDPDPFGWPIWGAAAVFLAILAYCLGCSYLMGTL